MARYTIDFTTNASKILKEIEDINKKVLEVSRTGKSVKITLDSSSLRASFTETFKELDNQIARMQRKLSNLPIGGRKFQQQATALGIVEGTRQRAGMQASAIQLGAQAEAFDIGSVQRLQAQLKAARIEASQISPNTPEWINFQKQIAQINLELKASDRLAESIQMQESLGAFAPGSLNSLEAKLVVLRNRAREISPNLPEWKQLNKEIAQTEQAIAKQTKSPLTKGQRLGAAGGAFLYGGGLGGGAGSAIGGITGGLAGGVPGAFTGAAIGQAVDNLQMMTAAMVEQSVVIDKLRLGLSSVSTDFNDFAKANQEIVGIANRLLLPLDEVYKKYTQLRASTRALGYDTETTAKVFEGTAAAVLRAGGSMDDVDGAMRAVVQVFSKGKLTAEELRGQLAERLPGAVVEFAQSAGMSLQELDKAFEGGTTSIDDFVKFLRGKAKETQSFTDEMATGSEYAGARMAKAFEGLRINIGRAFQPTGAAIQDFATRSIKFLDQLIDKAIEFKLIQPGSGFYAEQVLQGETTRGQLQEQIAAEQARVKASKEQGLAALVGGANTIAGKILTDLGGSYSDAKLKELQGALKELEKYDKNFKQAAKQAAQQAQDQQRPQKMLDAVDRREEALASARESYEQEIASIRENAIKQAEALEQRYQDQRLQDEREIGRVRREIAAATQEESLLTRSIGGADPALIEQERKIGDAIRQYTEDKISREETAQDRQNEQSRELEDFKKQNADAINKANEKYARAIGKINQDYAKSVAKLVEDGSGNGAKRLAAAGKLIAADIQRATQQQAFTAATGGAIIPRENRTFEVAGDIYNEQELIDAANAMSKAAGTAAKAYVDATKQIEQAQKSLNATMKTTAQVSVVPYKSIDTSSISSGVQKDQAASQDRMAALNKEKAELSKQVNIRNALLEAVKNATDEQNANKREIDKQANSTIHQIDLIKGGMLPALAEQSVATEDLFDKARNLTREAANQLLEGVDNKDVQKDINKILEEQLRAIGTQEEAYLDTQSVLRDNLGLLEEARIKSETKMVGAGLRAGFINEAGAAYEDQIAKGVSPEIAANVAKATEQMKIAQTTAESLQGAINGIGDAFGQAMTMGVASLISGTATAKEVFADFLKSVGQALLDAAAKMIATYIAIGIARMFAGFSGGGSSYGSGNVATDAFSQGGIPGLSNTASIGIPGTATGFKFATGGIANGGFRAFAAGGVVNGPTLGLVGEGGENEYIIPASKMPQAMARYAAGARGSAVIPGQGTSGGGGTINGGGASIDVRYSVQRINSVDYVTAEQFQRGIQQAAKQGAQQGERNVLGRLQNSPSARRRIGM